MSEKMFRTRFAPSPTGYVHIGSLRTALFSFLFARSTGGVNVLRIEDTDQNRLVEGAAENLIKVLNSVGIKFDEGLTLQNDKLVEIGDYGPYTQSKRLSVYKENVLKLVKEKKAYYCFCSETRLDELRREQIALKKPPMYDRFCRKLSDLEVEKKLQEFEGMHMRPVIRQAIPEEGQTIIKDIIYGEIAVENRVLDDQVLLKSDGYPTYHLAVVVDDHFMEITHVIRGEEWISSTPKHILLYKAFGWEPTQFAHLPLITNPDKTKLSKRQGDVSVESYLEKGFLKDALVNFVAFLGWNPKTEREIFSIEDLISEFDLAKVNKASAVFDIDKLEWMNGLYIRKMETTALVELLVPYWTKEGVEVKKYSTEYLEMIVELEKERLKKLSDIFERTKYFFAEPEYEGELLIWKKANAEACKLHLEKLTLFLRDLADQDFERKTLEDKVKLFIADNELDNGTVLWPLRVSLTGLSASPGPFEVASTIAFGLGKEVVLQRIGLAIQKLQKL